MLTAGIIAGAVLVLLLVQRRNLGRLWTAASAQFGKLSRFIWRIDPIAIYQAEVDKSADEIQEAGEGLAEFKGHVARLERKVTNGQKRVEDLKTKIRNLLLEHNEAKATNYVLELQTTQNDLTKDQQKLEEQEVLYQKNLKKVKFANQKIREAKEKAEKMSYDLRMSKADAEISKLAQNFEIKTSSIYALGEIEEEVQRQIDANRATGQVIHDLGNDGIEDIEEQEKLQHQQAQKLLEQFKQELLPLPNIEVKILPPISQHEQN